MADEQKETVETLQNPPEKPESEEQEGEHIDYRALYEDEKGRRAKAESVIQRHAEKPKEESEESEESAPNLDLESIRATIREEVDELRSSLTSQFRVKEIGDAISRVAPDPSLAALVRYHYDNSIRQSGDLELDVENAFALANKARAQSQIEEVKAALDSRSTRSSGSSSGQKPKIEPDDEVLPPLTAVDRQTVDFLRQKYVLSNAVIRRILKGERLADLIEQGVIKARYLCRKGRKKKSTYKWHETI